MRRWVVVAVLVVSCGGEGGGRNDGPYLLVKRPIDGIERLAQVPAKGGPPRAVLDEIAGRVKSALVLEGGRALLVAVTPPGGGDDEVWRVEVAPYRATRAWSGRLDGALEAASRDGEVVSLGNGSVLLLGDEPGIVDLDPPEGQHWRMGDLSADGQRLLVSFGPDCEAGAQPRQCRLEVWGYDRGAPGWRVIARDDQRTAYNPRFLPGTDRVIYHLTVLDPKLADPWGRGREDLVAIDWDGGDPELLHPDAWTVRPTRDGRTIAAVSTPPGKLLVGRPDGDLEPIADDAYFAAVWSEDGRWHAYTRSDGAALIRIDGEHHRVLDEGRSIGWLDRPLPTGAEVPRTPTREEATAAALEAALSRAEQLRPGDPIGAVGTEERPGVTLLRSTAALAGFLKGDERVVGIAPSNTLCELGHAAHLLAEVGDRVIVTNRLAAGEQDLHPVRPGPVGAATPGRAVLGNAVELGDVQLPPSVRRGVPFTMTLSFRSLQAMPGAWKVFVHFDGAGVRFASDHYPPCPTSSWQPGDMVTDRFEVTSGDVSYPPSEYAVYAGLFTGTAPNWRRATVTGVDAIEDRVRIGTLRVE